MFRFVFSYAFISLYLIFSNPAFSATTDLSATGVQYDTIPVMIEKKIITRIIDGEEVTSVYENGRLSELSIDGIDIAEEDFELYREKWDLSDNKGFGNDSNSFKKERIGPKFFEEGLFNIDLDSMFGNMFRSFGFKLDGDGLIKRYDKNFEDFDFSQDFYFDSDSFEFNLGDFFRQFSDEGGLEGQIFMRPDGDLREKEMEYGTKSKLETKIGEKLNQDGLLTPNKLNEVELSGKHLKINGEKQNDLIFNRYKSIFEEETGIQLDPKSKLFFKIEGKKSNRKLKSF